MSVLDEIVAHKQRASDKEKRRVPPADLEMRATAAEPPLDFLTALRASPGVGLIAEVKRASPSRGLLRKDLDPVGLASAYERGGAAAISVLTENHFFQGSLQDLSCIRKSTRLPLLAKDFVLEPYHVLQARAHGADAILLVLAILDDDSLAELFQLSCSLGMVALLEVHDEGEVQRALALRPSLIGINNRSLRDFSVDLSTTLRLRPFVPQGVVVVSESGIHSQTDVKRLSAAGVDAVLVGEALVKAANVEAMVRALLGINNDQG